MTNPRAGLTRFFARRSAAAAAVRASPATPGFVSTPRGPASPSHPWRVLLGALLLLLACVCSSQWIFAVASTEARVTGRVVPVRTPIAGTVQGDVLDVGAAVAPETLLARVVDEFLDPTPRENLRSLCAQLETRRAASLAAIRTQEDSLLALRAHADRHRSLLGEYLWLRLLGYQANALVLGRRVAAAEAAAGRQQALGDAGLVAQAERERAALCRTEARAALRGLHLEQRAALRQLHALGGGHFLGIEQPADAGRLRDAEARLPEMRIEAQALAANLADAERRLAAEQSRMDKLRRTDLRSPVAGRILRRAVSAGQLVQPGETTYLVAESRSLHVEALFHQRWIRSIAPGDSAKIVLFGRTLSGRVRCLLSSWCSEDPTMAASAPGTDATHFIAVIEIDAESDPGDLHVGEKAEVCLVGAGSGWLARLGFLLRW